MAAGRNILFTAIALMSQIRRNVQADCASDLVSVVSDPMLPIQENSPAGTVILNITRDYNHLYMAAASTPDFLALINGSIVTQDVSLDGPQNAANCTKSKTSQPTVMLYCNNDVNNGRTWLFYVNYTDDYGPYFTAVATSIYESALVGNTVIDLSTIVRDDDCTNSFNYYIDDKSKEYFKLMGSSLELAKSLDYETAQEHYINVTALSSIQNGPGSLRNSTNLTIHVLDVDDMSPVFDISQFLLRLPEGQDISANWYNTTPPIKARDGDVGIMTPLAYSIHSVSPSLSLQIDNQTGQVKVLEQLDREYIRVYTVVVRASQIDVPYRSATGTLLLLVEDANDNRPVFTSQPSAAILEDAPDGSYVMELTGEDKDEGDNSLFDFVITSDSVASFKTRFDPTTNRTQLVVGNSTALRGHTQAVVTFYLRELRPIVGPPCTNTTTCFGSVTIDIIDVNDNTPQFNSTSYTFTLPSNTSGRHVIGEVLAVDADKGNNAVVRYKFIHVTGPSECSNITLDPSAGVLTTDQHLPAGATCFWIVSACDSPTDPHTRRCSSVPVTVFVLPAGRIVENSVTIPENVPVGTMVKLLPVTGLHTPSMEFEIRNDSVLYTKVPLDRERQDSYEVDILADQNVTDPVMIVYVNISDVNDNAPIFGQSVYVINIDSSWKINQTVLQVNATDADVGLNAQMEFSMASGTEYFAIDPTTGQIQLTNFPPRDSEYQLLVTDFGPPSFSSVSTLKVYSPVHNETATVILPVSKDELMADRDDVARKLGSILGKSVKIYNIESLGPAGSTVYIGATSAQGQPVTPTELNKLLDTHAMEIYNTFAKSTQPGVASDGGGTTLSVLEIVLICLACVLLILALVTGSCWYRSHKKLRQSRRLFDSLNKNTAIYDNPRKPSSSAAVIANNNNNNSTNAQRMMARLSSGSVGNSSVTNLLTAQGDGNNSQGATPPGSNGSQRRQQNHDYVNVVPPLSSPVVDREDIEGTSPVEEDQVQITTFSSQITDEDITNTSYPHTEENNQHEHANSQPWPGDNTAFSDRRNSSTISDTETQLEDADEDDQEVAGILSDPNLHSLEDTVDSPTDRSNLDLMTTSDELDGARPGGIDNPAYMDTENPEISVLPEPEPDYAKRVRFTDVTATTDSSEPTNNSPDSDDKDLSLAKFLNQYGGAENLATNADTTQDSLEEITAL